MRILKALGLTAVFCLMAAAAQAQVPRNQYPLNASSGNVAAGTAAASLAAAQSTLNYVTGFEITGAGATAGACVTATLAGLVGGTLSYTVCAPTGAAVGFNPLVVTFPTPIPATSVNVAATLSMPSLGAGNLFAAVVLHGFQLTP